MKLFAYKSLFVLIVVVRYHESSFKKLVTTLFAQELFDEKRYFFKFYPVPNIVYFKFFIVLYKVVRPP